MSPALSDGALVEAAAAAADALTTPLSASGAAVEPSTGALFLSW